MIEEERQGMRGDPVQEQAVWLQKLADVDQRRASFHDMAAEGLITFDELRTKLAALEETGQLARRELDILQDRRERLQDLERDKTALLEHYAGMVLNELDDLSSEERHRVYKMLGLKVTVQPSGVLEVSGTFGEGLAQGHRPRFIHQPAGHRPLLGRLRDSLLRRADRGDRRPAGGPDRGGGGAPGAVEQEAPPRAA